MEDNREVKKEKSKMYTNIDNNNIFKISKVDLLSGKQ